MDAEQTSDTGGAHADGARAASLEALFRDHHAAVFRAAFRVTGNAGEAEDALQTVFLNLLRRGGAAEQLAEAPRRYLARAGINAALDALRARRGDASLETVAEPAGDPAALDADVWRGQVRARLRAALAKLSPRAAEMVALHYFEGYRNVEIAAIFSTSASAVGVTLHRARQRLKAELGDIAHDAQ